MLDLTDEETDAIARLLSRTIDDDRYPLSPRIQTLKGILAKIRPEPVRKPLPRPKVKREAVHRRDRVLRSRGEILRRFLRIRTPVDDSKCKPGGHNRAGNDWVSPHQSPPDDIDGRLRLSPHRLQISCFILDTLNTDCVARPVIAGVGRHADSTFLSRDIRTTGGGVRVGLGAPG